MKKVFDVIIDFLDSPRKKDQNIDKSVWSDFLTQHPVDIASFVADLSRRKFAYLFIKLPKKIKRNVFNELPDSLKAFSLSLLDDSDISFVLRRSTLNKLVNIFDYLSDSALKKYLSVLQKDDRERVLSLLRFDPESAAGVMDTDVFSLEFDLTVDKCVKLLQRIRSERELHHHIYVTNQFGKLVGHIHLEDLILGDPTKKIGSFARENKFVAKAHEDRELIAKEAVKYHFDCVPVVNDDNYFLGTISSEKIASVIGKEAGEDLYRMSALKPIRRTYFEISFARLVYQRSYILIILLLAQSISTMVLGHFESMLTGFLILFVTMLTSAGGNASSQTSAIAIQGLASGEINEDNTGKFMRREMLMALTIASILGVTAFARGYFTSPHSITGATIVGLTVFVIVLVATLFGFIFPLVLRRFNIDPAFSAGPFLTTLMDILGLIIYCYIGKLILSYFLI